jgi:hypothetical protein
VKIAHRRLNLAVRPLAFRDTGLTSLKGCRWYACLRSALRGRVQGDRPLLNLGRIAEGAVTGQLRTFVTTGQFANTLKVSSRAGRLQSARSIF